MRHSNDIGSGDGAPAQRVAMTPSRNRARFVGVPLRMLIPNVVTLLALSAGVTAIRFVVEGSVEWAVMAIAAAAVLDGLDGRIARALKGTSRFGAELDSLADFVDFGVAPAIILYFSGLTQLHAFGWLVCLLFAIAAALRLARFNVMIDDPEFPAWRKGFFVGMPAPAGAVVGLLPVYIKVLGGAVGEHGGPAWLGLEAAYVLAIAMLMASRVPHFSGKSIGRVPRDYVAVALIGVVAALLSIAYFPLEALVGLAAFYLGSIPFAIRRYRRLEAEALRTSVG
jgi:CDP-diacylglycerol--serine O-phosphatidyltransferase